MDTLLLLARLLLAAVFAVSGIAKLLDQPGTRAAVVGFGVPQPLARPFAVLLPVAELAVVALLLPNATAWLGAVGALVLLVAFIAGIAVNMAQGRRPDCHCFGQLHSEPIGWPTLIRNVVLSGIAGLVLYQGSDNPGTSPFGWLQDASAGELLVLFGGLVLFGLVAAQWWFMVHILGQNGRLLERVEALEAAAGNAPGADGAAPRPAQAIARREPGLPVGTPAPAFSLPGLHWETTTLEALRARGKPILLLSTDPNCGPCSALMPEVVTWQRRHGQQLTIVAVSRGTLESNQKKYGALGLSDIVVQQDREVAEAYEARGTPSAVIVQPDGMIGSPVAAGSAAIRALVERHTAEGVPAAASAAPPSAVAAQAPAGGATNGQARIAAPQSAGPRPLTPMATRGHRAPAVVLPDLTGTTVDLESYRGRQVAVLFWNPGCGFCRRMVDDLKAWEANPPASAPDLLVVSTGTPEANQALGLSSPTVLDEGFQTGRKFGASGTPSAVLVDARGLIASPVVVGADNVFSLLDPARPKPAPSQNGGAVAAARVGDEAPEIRLDDLDGRPVNLAELRGTPTMLLFWNPGCGFCRRMVDDLKAWEASPPANAPKLLIVSTGAVDANRELGLSSMIVLDEGFSVGRRFGASGTPSAVLVDAQGRVASSVAVGAPAVLALAGKQPATA
jgi:peroxiredoxin/uncharacterized membrane protein YphA (DoxX/SURF4 family)